MADLIVPTITLAPRAPKGRETVTVTATNDVTVFITDEVTVFLNKTIEITKSIFDTSFIHVTHNFTDTITSTNSTTATETQMLTLTPAHPTSSHPAPICSTVLTHGPPEKHVDPFQVLSIALGVVILLLIVLMWFLVRRFYKMYRAERVMRKQLHTEGTELPSMSTAVNTAETHVVGEE